MTQTDYECFRQFLMMADRPLSDEKRLTMTMAECRAIVREIRQMIK